VWAVVVRAWCLPGPDCRRADQAWVVGVVVTPEVCGRNRVPCPWVAPCARGEPVAPEDASPVGCGTPGMCGACDVAAGAAAFPGVLPRAAVGEPARVSGLVGAVPVGPGRLGDGAACPGDPGAGQVAEGELGASDGDAGELGAGDVAAGEVGVGELVADEDGGGGVDGGACAARGRGGLTAGAGAPGISAVGAEGRAAALRGVPVALVFRGAAVPAAVS